jgi:N-dimethylarginine dimethylaminohydrolase
MIYRRPDDLDFALADRPRQERPGNVLLTTPDYFDVEYAINPHMEGKAGTVDKTEALRQWEAVRETYDALDLDVHVTDGAAGLPDMVFCANQTLPYLDPREGPPEAGRRGVVLSRMRAEERREEVPYYAGFFSEHGYDVRELSDQVDGHFEGMGDALWHPGRHLLWGGHGFRTAPRVYDALSEMLGVPVVLLELADEDFYHLDTCLCPLDEQTALVYPGAFTEKGRALVRQFFENTIEVPAVEAREGFACNAHCPDGEHVLIQRGCDVTTEQLVAGGFTPVELETGEFLKSGGSVFCMKLMFW